LTLSFSSIGTRVGLIFLFRAVVPLNFWRLQNLMAHRPSGTPCVATARLECIRISSRRDRRVLTQHAASMIFFPS
jgi:hypothetical protein